MLIGEKINYQFLSCKLISQIYKLIYQLYLYQLEKNIQVDPLNLQVTKKT